MSRSEIKSIIESIMFAYGEPISVKELNYAINEELSPKEIEFLEANSFILAGLGPRIMRAETAPLYFLASLSFALELSWD